MCAELNLLPDQYYDLTIGEILRHWHGYETRNSKEWEKARFVAWVGALPYDTKGRLKEQYDLMALPTDPSPEERALIQEERVEEMKKAANKIYEHYRNMGFNV
jgi:hypothetical protein